MSSKKSAMEQLNDAINAGDDKRFNEIFNGTLNSISVKVSSLIHTIHQEDMVLLIHVLEEYVEVMKKLLTKNELELMKMLDDLGNQNPQAVSMYKIDMQELRKQAKEEQP